MTVRTVLPDWVVASMVDEELTAQERYWNPILQRIDPYLRLVRPFRDPPVFEMVPNRWHLSRINEQGVELHIPIMGPDGEYREMDEAMLQALMRKDMQSSRSERINRETSRQREAARERQKQREREDRRTSLAERIYSKENVSVSVPKKVS